MKVVVHDLIMMQCSNEGDDDVDDYDDVDDNYDDV